MTGDWLNTMVGVGLIALIVVILVCGMILLEVVHVDGGFDRIKSIIRRQPRVCPDCGRLTTSRSVGISMQKHWTCPNAAYPGRCYNAIMFNYPNSVRMAVPMMTAAGRCAAHPRINLNCEMCRYVLREQGIDLE